MAWPLHRWISRRIDRPWLAALTSTMAVVVLILVPGLFVSYQLTIEAAAAERLSDSAEGAVRQTLDLLPGLQPIVAWAAKVDFDVEGELRKVIAAYTQDARGLAQGSIAAIIQLLVAVFILYHVLLDRAHFLHQLRDLLPLSRSEGTQVLTRAADSVHANLHATLIRGLIDGISGGLMFWLLGWPPLPSWAGGCSRSCLSITSLMRASSASGCTCTRCPLWWRSSAGSRYSAPRA
jgi:predicted PurR-regulated permease PerM